ncbi:hypothetical protein HYC85_007932 [Camellia sinensis]|uniref:Uncharacterized protein n=1 Tax=Camellia sinensis TaxID=4442 RepID=A0A7J7HSQ5_CAMSI|nr:hypothetical protein HYC85_007932 [Camellia sinensis]
MRQLLQYPWKTKVRRAERENTHTHRECIYTPDRLEIDQILADLSDDRDSPFIQMPNHT